jgi:hypothetical protein
VALLRGYALTIIALQVTGACKPPLHSEAVVKLSLTALIIHIYKETTAENFLRNSDSQMPINLTYFSCATRFSFYKLS